MMTVALISDLDITNMLISNLDMMTIAQMSDLDIPIVLISNLNMMTIAQMSDLDISFVLISNLDMLKSLIWTSQLCIMTIALILIWAFQLH